MSPIGRVFIVLNLGLAVAFLMVSGTHLQQQNNFKTQLEAEKSQRAEEVKTFTSTIARLESERNQFENAKTANETRANEASNRIANLQDENKRLTELTSQQMADLKRMTSLQEAANTENKAAFQMAKDAYAMATADQKVKDEAVRAKDTAESENRTLKTEIASLNDRIVKKDLEIAALDKDRSELNLLVSVAKAKGFLASMAAPSLAGTVTNASGRLCTIKVTDNPGSIDIADQLSKGAWSFAIYDNSGYKGEAVATKYEASANAVLCNVYLVKGEIREGDKATTQTP